MNKYCFVTIDGAKMGRPKSRSRLINVYIRLYPFINVYCRFCC